MSAALPGRPRRGPLRRAAEFIREVLGQASHDNVLFLASGLTFSLLLAAVPFLLLLLSAAVLLLAPRFRVAPSDVMERVWEIFPVSDPAIREEVGRHIGGVIESAGSLGLIGGLLFLWFSARFFSSVRAALGAVLDVREGPGTLRALGRDAGLVVLSTLLLAANVGLTSALGGVGARYLARLGVDPGPILSALGVASAWGIVFLMYWIVYRVAPGGRLRWRTAAVAALFAATAFEVIKIGLGWYVQTFGGTLGRVSFALTTLLVMGAALYWNAVTFLVGGEVAKVTALRRITRSRLEMFEGA